MLKSFKPHIDGNTKIMVIGSMPGRASLEAGQYYAYKHNAFWRIIFDIFADGREPLDYHDKLAVLSASRIGLWDTLAACLRQGSLDSNIKNAAPNDFKALFKKYPKVQKLIFNGQASYSYFKKYFGNIEGIEYLVMPSTSPANAAMPYEEKLKLWRTALKG